MDTRRPEGGSSRQPGLEQRMGREVRRISSQHRQLDELYGLVEVHLHREDADGARVAFERFGDALEAHFSLEETLYFPALHGMRPELEEPLTRLAGQHERLREAVRSVAAKLAATALHAAEALLDELVRALARHEGEEEQLVERFQADRGGR